MEFLYNGNKNVRKYLSYIAVVCIEHTCRQRQHNLAEIYETGGAWQMGVLQLLATHQHKHTHTHRLNEIELPRLVLGCSSSRTWKSLMPDYLRQENIPSKTIYKYKLLFGVQFKVLQNCYIQESLKRVVKTWGVTKKSTKQCYVWVNNCIINEYIFKIKTAYNIITIFQT